MREAIKHFELAIENSQKAFGEGSIFEAKCYDGLGEVYFAWERYSQAVEQFKQALAIKKRLYNSRDRELILSNYNIGRAYYKVGDTTESIRFLNDALVDGLYLYKKDNPLNVKINNLISIVNGGGGSFKIRLKDYILKYGRFSLKTANLYHDMALQYKKSQNLKSSLEFYKKSLEIYKEKLPFLHSKVYNTFLDLAILYKKLGDSKQYSKNALSGFDSFYANQQAIFSTLNSVEKKAYLQSRREFLYHLFLSSNKSRVKEVFNRWLNYKRKLYDEENSLKILYNKTDNSEIKKKIKQLFAKQREIARAYQGSSKKDVKKLKDEVLELEAFLNLKSFDYKRERGVKDITYQDISNLLKPKELYIDFAKIKNDYYYFILDKAQNISIKKLTENEIKIIKDRRQREIRDGKNGNLDYSKGRYAEIYDLIIRDKIDIKDKTSLIISPDGELGLIPFEAFYDDKEKKYLIEKLKIRYIPSGKELVKLYRDNSKTDSSDIVVFSDVDFPPRPKDKQDLKGSRGSIFNTLEKNGYWYLQYSKRESDKIKELFKDNVKEFLQNRATEENLLKVNRPKILHLSTHGEFINDGNISNPLRKALILLSGADKSIKEQRGDGIVSGLELAGLNLEGTELVVLSACKTGVGEVEDSEGVAGMSKAFMKAGAKYIIMTLWSVSDEKSALLMEKFYEGVKRGLSYSDALREAKLFMIRDEKTALPYYWSGFVGSGRD